VAYDKDKDHTSIPAVPSKGVNLSPGLGVSNCFPFLPFTFSCQIPTHHCPKSGGSVRIHLGHQWRYSLGYMLLLITVYSLGRMQLIWYLHEIEFDQFNMFCSHFLAENSNMGMKLSDDVINCKLTSFEVDAANALNVRWTSDDIKSNTSYDVSASVTCLLRLGLVSESSNASMDYCSTLNPVAETLAIGGVSCGRINLYAFT